MDSEGELCEAMYESHRTARRLLAVVIPTGLFLGFLLTFLSM